MKDTPQLLSEYLLRQNQEAQKAQLAYSKGKRIGFLQRNWFSIFVVVGLIIISVLAYETMVTNNSIDQMKSQQRFLDSISNPIGWYEEN